MAILARVLQKIFASTAGPTETGVIGSEDAGSPTTSSNLLTIQSLAQYLAGMYAITASGAGLPKIEDMNSLFLLITSQLAYIFQNGIAEYDATTNYYNNISYVQVNGVIYQSINGTGVSPNIGNAPASSPTKWRALIDTDATLAANSDLVVPSQKALKTALTLYVNLTVASTGAMTITNGKTLVEKSSRTIQGTDGNVIDTDAIIRSTYQGLLMTWVSNTSFSVGAGCVGDNTFVSTMLLASTLTKTTSAWAVGSAAGGLDTGAIAASTWYYVYVIKRPDTGVVDVLFSTSSIAPTMPTNYTLKRLIGAVKTNGSSQFVSFIMYADGTQQWNALVADVADSTLTTARKSYPLTSIPNVQCDVLFEVSSSVTGSGYIIYLAGDTNITDVAPSNGSPPIGQVSNVVATTQPTQTVRLHMTSATLYARSTVASTTLFLTAAWFNLRPFN